MKDNSDYKQFLSLVSPKENSKIENNTNTNIMHPEKIEIENNTNIIQPNKIEPSIKTYRFNIKDNGCDLPCKDIVLAIPEKSKFSIGDGHGSMLAVFRRLYMAGFFSNISQKNYQALKELYNLPKAKITREKMLEFLRILRVSWDDKFDQRSVETIGDLFGDRGKNDIWTILLLGFLAEKIQSPHLMGNHDFEIIPTFFEKNENKCLQFSRQGMDSPTVNSANNLFSWLETVKFESNSQKIPTNQSQMRELTEIEKVVGQAEAPMDIIHYFWDKIYSTSLKLLSVEQTTDDGLTISTHAPNDHAIVFSLATYLSVEKIGEIKEKFDLLIKQLKYPNQAQKLEIKQQAQKLLVDLANQINVKFSEILKNKTLHQHFPDLDKIDVNTFKVRIEEIKKIDPNSLMLYWLTRYGTTQPRKNASQEAIRKSGILTSQLKQLEEYFTFLLNENKVPLVLCMWNRDIETREKTKKNQILLKDFGNSGTLPTEQIACAKKFFDEDGVKRLLFKHKGEYYFALGVNKDVVRYLKLTLSENEKQALDLIDFKQKEISYDEGSIIYKVLMEKREKSHTKIAIDNSKISHKGIIESNKNQPLLIENPSDSNAWRINRNSEVNQLLSISYIHGHDSCPGLSPVITNAYNTDSGHGKTDTQKGGELYEGQNYPIVVTCKTTPLLNFRSQMGNLIDLLAISKREVDQFELELCKNIAINLNEEKVFNQLMNQLPDVEKSIKNSSPTLENSLPIKNSHSFFSFSREVDLKPVPQESAIAKFLWQVIDSKLTQSLAYKDLDPTVFASNYWEKLMIPMKKALHEELGRENIFKGVSQFEEIDSAVFKDKTPKAFGKDFFACLNQGKNSDQFKYVYCYILKSVQYVKNETSGRAQFFLLYTMFNSLLENCKQTTNQDVKNFLSLVHQEIAPLLKQNADKLGLTSLPFLAQWEQNVPKSTIKAYLTFASQSDHNLVGQIRQNFSNN